MKSKPQPPTHREPAAVRRKLVSAYRQLAAGRRFTPAERAEFAKIAAAWAATLPK
jgi:hypothetical protein